MTNATHILGNWFRVLGLQGVAFLFAATTIALAASVVPPAVFGEYTLLLSTMQITAGVGFSWLNQSIFRFAREEFNTSGSVWSTLGTALSMQAALLVAVAPLAWLAATLYGERFGLSLGMLPWLLAGLTMAIIVEAFSFACQAANRFSGYGAGQVLTKFGPLAVVLVFTVGFPASTQMLLLGTIGGWLLSATYQLLRLPPRRRASLFDQATLRRLVAYGWKLPLATASGIIVSWLGIWAIRYFLDVHAAGIYAWAFSLYSLGVGLLMAFSAVIAPRMTDLRLYGSTENIERMLRFAVSASALLATLMPLALVLVTLAGTTIWPIAYADAELPLLLLLSSFPGQLLTYIISPLLMAYQQAVGRVVTINMAAAAANVAANLLLVPAFGLAGAALAASLTIWLMALPLILLIWQIGCGHANAAELAKVAATGLGSIVCALAVVLAPPALAPVIGLVLLGTGLFLGRQLHWFHHLRWLAPHLGSLPLPLRRPAVALLGWFATSVPSGAAHP